MSVYVDDFCLAAPRALITDHCDLLVHTLADLGIHVNFEKSQLSSSRCLDYLGYTIRVGNEDGFPFIAAQSRRVKQLQRDIKRALNKPLITARTLARIAGQCISIAWCVEPAKLLLRGVYRLLSTRSTWESTLVFDNDTREDLRWWQNAVQFWNGKSICHRPISAQVITDASHLAWGGGLRTSPRGRRLESCHISSLIELQRATSHSVGPQIVSSTISEQICTNFDRQCYSTRLCPTQRGTESRTYFHRPSHLDPGGGEWEVCR